MGSLDKIKNEKELSIWKDKFTANSVVVSEKLDGVSLEVVYENGNISLYTRGDGTYGRNISHILKYIEIPKPVANIAIRAEIIIPKSEFIPFYKESNNPESFNLRNCVSGLINRTKTAVPELKDAHVVAYEIIDSSSTMEEQLNNLQVMGFKVPKYVVLDQHEFTYKNLAELLAEWKEKSDYNIDGVVVTANSVYVRNIDGNPDYAFAFKQLDDNNVSDATVTEIEWNISRHGVIKPVMVIEPVKLAGVVIRRITAHNAQVIYRNNIGKGAIIKITRSGDVIPYLLDVVKPATVPDMPTCSWEWNETGVDIVYTGNRNREQDISKIEYFFSTIGVEGLGLAIVTKLYDYKFDTVKKIIDITVDDLLGIEGFQKRSATRLIDNINAALQNVTLDMLMNASGVFGIGLGAKRCAQIFSSIPNVLEYSSMKELQHEINKIPGFSTIVSSIFIEGLPKFIEFYKELAIPVKTKVLDNVDNLKFSGKTVVFSGVRDKELERYIVDNGGNIGSSISKNTSILVVKDSAAGSSKVNKARELNVLIKSIHEFKEEHNV